MIHMPDCGGTWVELQNMTYENDAVLTMDDVAKLLAGMIRDQARMLKPGGWVVATKIELSRVPTFVFGRIVENLRPTGQVVILDLDRRFGMFSIRDQPPVTEQHILCYSPDMN